jgi:16S rRNA (guanine527-N7)-methyltransferase
MLAQFDTYLSLLLKWNSKLNLTGVRQPEMIVSRHLVECIQCAQALPEAAALLDFGSGAGLPGLPIAICRPELRVTLAESQRKKAAFLREAVRSLALNTEVFDGRVEDMAEERLFPIVTLRAVDRMADACRVALSRLAPSGWMVLFATEGTEAGFKAGLPGVEWRRELPISGLSRGVILFGQRA